MAKDILLV